MIYVLSDFFSFFVVDLIWSLIEKVPESAPRWRNTQFESQAKELSR